ncbi:MAG: P-loop NTPase [Desulfobacteraceae bacterium]
MTPPRSGYHQTTSCRIIAVGGAKGGIGKSILAANLGVYLARKGFRTVLVDLDLGAANLHLYMGVWGLKHRIDDYLDKQSECLDAIAVETDHGPLLIGGGSGRLGSANLPFTRKLKLMRAIRKLDADVAVLDLGASTHYNILDFFLLADTQLVMTTCDPAAYLDAYTFVKMALYRRLARLFGSESKYRKFKDEALQEVIQSFVAPDRRHLPDKVCDLMNRIQARFPRHHYLVADALHHFQPKLVVNLADIQEEVRQVVTRLQKVADRMLSTRIQLAGTIFSDRNIARSTRDLKPEVDRHPNGLLARAIGQIVRQARVAS